MLASLLVTADAHLITLSDAFVGFVAPSKVYGCIESRRPILYVGSDRSDVDLLCRETVRLGQTPCDGHRALNFTAGTALPCPGCAACRPQLIPTARGGAA